MAILNDKEPLPLYAIKLMTLMSEASRLVIDTIYKFDRFKTLLNIYDTNHK